MGGYLGDRSDDDGSLFHGSDREVSSGGGEVKSLQYKYDSGECVDYLHAEVYRGAEICEVVFYGGVEVSEFRSLAEACEDFKRRVTFEDDDARERWMPLLVSAFWAGVVSVSNVAAVAALQSVQKEEEYLC
jgi:hypothetical protein